MPTLIDSSLWIGFHTRAGSPRALKLFIRPTSCVGGELRWLNQSCSRDSAACHGKGNARNSGTIRDSAGPAKP